MPDTAHTLSKKVALITGGSGDIGEAVCFAFAAAGARMMLMDTDKARGKDIETRLKKEGCEARFHKGDTGKTYDVKKALAEIEEIFGTLDILVNNASHPLMKSLEDTSEEEWDRVMEMNLKGAFLAVKYSLPLLRRGDGGRIINISSVYGLVGAANQAAYGAAMGGMISLTRHLAAELAPEGITVNCLSLGGVETSTTRHYVRTSQDPEDAERRLMASMPLKRLASPREAGKMALFLAGEDTGFCTGANLVIDGGFTAI
ncbi:MAG: SDR family oxidoreductase [Actinomycetota bacterium]|nr:SDR family oxidoreductase [Actinomycetota bacterium]